MQSSLNEDCFDHSQVVWFDAIQLGKHTHTHTQSPLSSINGFGSIATASATADGDDDGDDVDQIKADKKKQKSSSACHKLTAKSRCKQFGKWQSNIYLDACE